MKKRAFAVFLAAILLLGILPGTALAVDTKGDISSTGLTIYSVEEAKSTVGSYTAGSGTVEVAYDESANIVTFTLTNATLNGSLSIADNNNNLNAKVVLNGESTVSSVYSAGTLTVKGSGGDKLTIDSGDNYALYGKNGITIEDSQIEATSMYTGIFTGDTQWNEEDQYNEITQEADITVKNSSVTIYSEQRNGFYATQDIIIEEDSVVTGECAFPLLYAVNSITIDGSTVNATTYSNGIYTEGTLTVKNGSKVTAEGSFAGIIAGSDITIQKSTVEASGGVQWYFRLGKCLHHGGQQGHGGSHHYEPSAGGRNPMRASLSI